MEEYVAEIVLLSLCKPVINNKSFSMERVCRIITHLDLRADPSIS